MTQREIGEILAKLSMMHEDIRELKQERKDLNSRVNKLEALKHTFIGSIGVVTTLLGYIIYKIKAFITFTGV